MSKSSSASKILLITWLIVVCSIILLLSFIMGAAIFRNINTGGDMVPEELQPIIQKLADTPSLVKQAVIELRDEITNKPSALLIPKNKVMKPDWAHQFPAPEDDGYLLLSGLGAQENQSIVQLIRISDGEILAKWIPDWEFIHRQTSGHQFAPKGNVRSYRAFHPLLLDDGSIIFNTMNSLIRLSLCSSKPSWILDYPYHHSIELSETGNSIWVPSVTEEFTTENPILKKKLRDDSLAEVDLDGRILQNLSFSKILVKNFMTSHMLGSTGTLTNPDPIHINQITVASSNTPFWQLGDLLISARHTSTIYLYRPSTDKIIWHKQGPWLNQHSPHFVGNNGIAIFGNDVYGSKLSLPFIYKEKHNNIYIYDFKNDKAINPYTEALNNIKPMTVYEGRSTILEDGTLFVEETGNSRLFKLSASGKLQWSYINTYDKDYLGVISWSRYYTPKQIQSKINAINLKCKN